MNQTVTVIRPAWRMERGNRLPDWKNATNTTVTGCRVQPMQGEEILFSGSASTEGGTARDARLFRYKLFAPIGADIDARDRVSVGGTDVYEVDGPPQPWPGPTGIIAHQEARLKRVDG